MENDQTKNQMWFLVLVCGVLAVIFYLLHDIMM